MSATPTESRSSRGETARATRRNEILIAARQVFAERGFRGTTISDVAEAAGVALGTIYLYFDSKEAVFGALSEQLRQLVSEAIDTVSGASLEELVRQRVDNVFRVCSENRDLVRLVVLNTDQKSKVTEALRRADEERNKPLALQIARGMEVGAVRRADPVIMTRMVRAATMTAVHQAFVVFDGTDADKYREECAQMIIAYMKPAQ